MTRPRSLFVKSQGTQRGVIPVPHDKFKYSQCVYTAPRTLVKCKELRTKEQLAVTKGLCEQHQILKDICKEQGAIENELLKLEVDNIAPVKYDNALRLGNHVTELTFLTEKPQWRGEVADSVNVLSVLEADANPLSHATHVSEKELIRAEIAALTKHSAKLKEMRKRNEEKARQRMQKLGVNSDKMWDDIVAGSSKKLDDDPMTNSIMKAHESSMKMEMGLGERVDAARERKTNLPACSYEWEVEGEKKRCTHNALPASQLCNQHILISTEQKIFVPCKICRDPCIDYGNDHPVCADHHNPMKKLVSPGGTTRTYRVQNAQKKNAPPWHHYDGNSPTQYTEVVLDAQSVFEDEEREEREAKERAEREKALHNSPSNAQRSATARKKTWDGTVGKPTAPTIKYDPGFMAAIMGTSQNTTTRRRNSLNEAQSMVCARERPFDVDEFNRTRLPQHRKGNTMTPQNVRSAIMQPMLKDLQQPLGPPSGSISGPSTGTLLPTAPPTSTLPHSATPFSPTLLPTSSIQSRIRPTNERPKIKPFGEAKESSRPYHLSSSSSSSHQEALAKMYGKTPAFAPNMKKEQERRMPASTPRLSTPLSAPRSSFPLGTTNTAANFARGLGGDPSSSAPSAVAKPSLQSSKMAPSTAVSTGQWTAPLSSSRPSHLNPHRPSPQLKSQPRDTPIGKKGLPSHQASSTWGSAQYNFQFKPVGGRSGGPQLPVRQALNEEKKSLVVRRPSAEVPRLSDPFVPSSSLSTTPTTSNTSLPALSLKEGKESPLPSPLTSPLNSPLNSPLSSPPQLTLNKSEASSSMESRESENEDWSSKGSHIRFDLPIEDIEEEDDFEEEL